MPKDNSIKQAKQTKKLNDKAKRFAKSKTKWQEQVKFLSVYFSNQYFYNKDIIKTELETFSDAQSLSQEKQRQQNLILSIISLKEDVKNEIGSQMVNVNFDAITNDYFLLIDKDLKEYIKAIDDIKNKTNHQLDFLIDLYNLIIAMTNDELTRQNYYKVVLQGMKVLRKENNNKPIKLNDELISQAIESTYIEKEFILVEEDV